MKLLLPDVIEFEYRRKVPEELDSIKQQTSRFRSKITTEVLPASDVILLHKEIDDLDNRREGAVQRAQAYLVKNIADPQLTIPIHLDGGIVSDAIGHVLAGRKPSKSTSQGLLDPDTLIIASVASYARSQELTKADTLLICSDNHKDFAVWDPEEKKHVIAQDIVNALPTNTRYYKDLRALVEKELDIPVEADQPLKEAFDEYEKMKATLASIALTKMADSIHANQKHLVEAFSNIKIPTIDPELLQIGIPRIDPELFRKVVLTEIDPEIVKKIQIANIGIETPQNEGDNSLEKENENKDSEEPDDRENNGITKQQPSS